MTVLEGEPDEYIDAMFDVIDWRAERAAHPDSVPWDGE